MERPTHRLSLSVTDPTPARTTGPVEVVVVGERGDWQTVLGHHAADRLDTRPIRRRRGGPGRWANAILKATSNLGLTDPRGHRLRRPDPEQPGISPIASHSGS